MDDTVEVVVPSDNSGMPPRQGQPQEAFLANFNNASGQRLYVLQNNQLVVPQENQFIWMEGAPIVTATTPEKHSQGVDQVLQQRMKQQAMLRTLQSTHSPRIGVVQKPCTDEMVRMIGMHNSRLMNVGPQQEPLPPKPTKPAGVDAAVGTDSPVNLQESESNTLTVSQNDQAATAQRAKSTPTAHTNRQHIRFPITPRPAVQTLGPPLPDTHEQISVVNDQKIMCGVTAKQNVEFVVRRQGIPVQATANQNKSPITEAKDVKVLMPTATPCEYQLYSLQGLPERARLFATAPQRPRAFTAGPSTPTNVVQFRMGQSPPKLNLVATRPISKPNATPQRTTCYTPVSRAATPPRANSPRQYPKTSQITRPPRPMNVVHVISPAQPKVAEPGKKIDKPAETETPALRAKKTVPDCRYIPGFLAVCPNCGISSLNFLYCDRCLKPLPENVKRQPITPPPAQTQTPRKQSTEDSPVDEGVSKTSKGSPTSSKKKKKVEEPVICVLSSDEEDNGNESSSNGALQNSQGLSKEPVYTAEEKLRIAPEPEINVPDEPSEPFTMMFHKAFRVGNYLTNARKPVYISAEGIHFTGTSSIYGSDVKVFIKTSSLKAVLVYYNEKEPMMFIYLSRETAARIRGLLGITNENFLFYDPCSNVQAFRRMILYLERVTDENKIVLENVLGKLLTVIDDNDKQSLMTCVHENIPVTTSETKLLSFNNFDVSKSDYACLADDTYINDLIIDFYIQYLYERKLSPTDRERTHIFSTYFYNRLTDNREKESSKEKPAEKRHKRVKSWTRKINIFEKDFIIIPINENSHWFLAVICFPYLTGPVRFHDNVPVPQEAIVPKKAPAKVSVQIGNTTITHCRSVSEHEEGEILLQASERDEAEAEDELSETEGDTEEPMSNPEPPPPEIPLLGTPEPEPEHDTRSRKQPAIKQPCILIFDSLRGSSSRARVVATLRDYLTVEYKTKTGQERIFNKQNIKGSILKVPQQDNYSDCGLFVLQYVESFFEHPLTDYRLPIRYLQSWFGENIHNKRKEVAELIQSLMFEQGIDPRFMNLPDLQARNHDMDDDFEEDADMELDNDDEDESAEETCTHGTIEEGEIPVTDENADQSAETQQSTPPPSTNPTQLIKKLLPGHGPADGVTRQTLKSIRIQRPAVRTGTDPDAKKSKMD